MTDNLILRTCIQEYTLKIYKTALYHELKLKFESELNIEFQKPPTKERSYNIREIKYEISRCKDIIEKSEKYNCETLKRFSHNNQKVLDFVDITNDLYCDFTDILLKSLDGVTKENPKNLVPAILEENINGSIEIKGKLYNLVVK